MTDPTRPEGDDETQHHETTGWDRESTPGPGPDSRPDPYPSFPGAAPLTPPPAAASASFSPAPEPRTDWAQARWAEPESPHTRAPERWFEAAGPVAARPATH
jgi:hypothetical protein